MVDMEKAQGFAIKLRKGINLLFSTAKATAGAAKDKIVTIWKRGVKGKIILCASMLLILWIAWPSGKSETVDDVRREIVASINTELSNQSSPIRKRIEDAHITVTVSNAYVLKCDITTIDGSAKVGTDRANISLVTVIVRFNWDGIFQKGELRWEKRLKSEYSRCSRRC